MEKKPKQKPKELTKEEIQEARDNALLYGSSNSVSSIRVTGRNNKFLETQKEYEGFDYQD